MDAFRKCDYDPHVIAAVANLFWHHSEVKRARTWLDRAVTIAQILGISGLCTSNLNFSMGLMRTRRMFCEDALLHNQSMVKNGNLFPRPCTTLTNQLKLSCIKWWLYSARKRARSRQGRRPKLIDSSRPFSWLLLFPGYISSKMFSKVGPLPAVSLVGILFICYSIYL
ncbi:pre-mRNA splicing factor-related protein [Prunus dulcis]|uniref:Pre-mRNA splicing factor-related protein n=1 Tax=Prunus dulcis TaxID=3755 RepID=A0A4Y1R2X4_PRUDU|nr:pre-mRNA splicing factor-related protein [Prunus dulcis]